MGIDLQVVKQYLRVTHDMDDDLIERLTRSSEKAAVLYLDWYDLYTPEPLSEVSETSSSTTQAVDPVIVDAVCVRVASFYEGTVVLDKLDAEEVFQRLLFPLRKKLGVY